MNCSSRVNEFIWTIQGKRFAVNVLLMPLKGCELILGIEWLNAVGVFKWYFPKRTMEFLLDGETVILRAKANCKIKLKE